MEGKQRISRSQKNAVIVIDPDDESSLGSEVKKKPRARKRKDGESEGEKLDKILLDAGIAQSEVAEFTLVQKQGMVKMMKESLVDYKKEESKRKEVESRSQSQNESPSTASKHQQPKVNPGSNKKKQAEQNHSLKTKSLTVGMDNDKASAGTERSSSQDPLTLPKTNVKASEANLYFRASNTSVDHSHQEIEIKDDNADSSKSSGTPPMRKVTRGRSRPALSLGTRSTAKPAAASRPIPDSFISTSHSDTTNCSENKTLVGPGALHAMSGQDTSKKSINQLLDDSNEQRNVIGSHPDPKKPFSDSLPSIPSDDDETQPLSPIGQPLQSLQGETQLQFGQPPENSTRPQKRKSDIAPLPVHQAKRAAAECHSHYCMFEGLEGFPRSSDTVHTPEEPLRKLTATRACTHIDERPPLHCPPHMTPLQYAHALWQYSEKYRIILYKTQQLMLHQMSWGKPVTVGRHMTYTLDLKVRGRKSYRWPVNFDDSEFDDEEEDSLPDLQTDAQSPLDSGKGDCRMGENVEPMLNQGHSKTPTFAAETQMSDDEYPLFKGGAIIRDPQPRIAGRKRKNNPQLTSVEGPQIIPESDEEGVNITEDPVTISPRQRESAVSHQNRCEEKGAETLFALRQNSRIQGDLPRLVSQSAHSRVAQNLNFESSARDGRKKQRGKATYSRTGVKPVLTDQRCHGSDLYTSTQVRGSNSLLEKKTAISSAVQDEESTGCSPHQKRYKYSQNIFDNDSDEYEIGHGRVPPPILNKASIDESRLKTTFVGDSKVEPAASSSVALSTEECPLCFSSFPLSGIEAHASECDGKQKLPSSPASHHNTPVINSDAEDPLMESSQPSGSDGSPLRRQAEEYDDLEMPDEADVLGTPPRPGTPTFETCPMCMKKVGQAEFMYHVTQCVDNDEVQKQQAPTPRHTRRRERRISSEEFDGGLPQNPKKRTAPVQENSGSNRQKSPEIKGSNSSYNVDFSEDSLASKPQNTPLQSNIQNYTTNAAPDNTAAASPSSNFKPISELKIAGFDFMNQFKKSKGSAPPTANSKRKSTGARATSHKRPKKGK